MCPLRRPVSSDNPEDLPDVRDITQVMGTPPALCLDGMDGKEGPLGKHYQWWQSPTE